MKFYIINKTFELEISRKKISLIRQKNSHEFYFQILFSNFLYNLFTIELRGGIHKYVCLKYFDEKYERKVKEEIYERRGIFFEIKIISIRLAVYYRPIVRKKTRQ